MSLTVPWKNYEIIIKALVCIVRTFSGKNPYFMKNIVTKNDVM